MSKIKWILIDFWVKFVIFSPILSEHLIVPSNRILDLIYFIREHFYFDSMFLIQQNHFNIGNGERL